MTTAHYHAGTHRCHDIYSPHETDAPWIVRDANGEIVINDGRHYNDCVNKLNRLLRLTSAKTLIPHYYLTVDCNLNALMAVREKMNAAAPKGKDKVPAYKLSVNDFIMKASAMALMKHPDVNASWTEHALRRWHSRRSERGEGSG